MATKAPKAPKPPKSGRKRASRLGRIKNLAGDLVELPGKLPEKIEEGLEKGLTVGVDILRDPVGTAQQVVDALQTPRGLALGWAVALILPVLLYFIDLGAGSLWQGQDAEFALILRRMTQGLDVAAAAHESPVPSGAPLGLYQMRLAVQLLGVNEAALRFLPVLAALGSAMCLLGIAIDVGVGRHAGGLAGLVLLAMPLTYELSHRVLPDMIIAVASTGAVALISHALHGHKFDRHILPIHQEADAPAPLPLRRLPMLFAALGIGAASLVDPRAGVCAILFGLLDVLLSHRYLLRKRRVWLMLSGGAVLTAVAAGLHPIGLRSFLSWQWVSNGHWYDVPLRNWAAIWHQGSSVYGRHVGPVIVVATGFGLLLGSMRRTSRPLLAWVIVAAALTWVGDSSPPPRGLGLVLPPLALAAAVGLQSPVRWLGSLGGIITAGALASVVLVTLESGPVLHKSDTLKLLSQSQVHAPPGAKLCTIGIPKALLTLYAGRDDIEELSSVEELVRTLGAPGANRLFSCVIPKSLRPRLEAALLDKPAPAPAPEPVQKGAPAGRKGRPVKDVRPPPKPAPESDALGEFGSVLATTLDVEEPPPDVTGPAVVLVSR